MTDRKPVNDAWIIVLELNLGLHLHGDKPDFVPREVILGNPTTWHIPNVAIRPWSSHRGGTFQREDGRLMATCEVVASAGIVIPFQPPDISPYAGGGLKLDDGVCMNCGQFYVTVNVGAPGACDTCGEDAVYAICELEHVE